MMPTSNGGSEVGGGSTGSGGSCGDIAAAAAIHGVGADMVAPPHHDGGTAGGGDVNGETILKKGPWTAEEDAILVDYVRKHGEGNWNAVQRHSGLSRCGKSCRLRWANHLRPNLKKGAFSPEEERLIVELHAKFGNKWARMASLLPGRTDNEIKNYWNTRVKRHQRQGLPLYPADIQPQQLPSSHFYHHPLHHNSQSISITQATPISSFSFPTHHLPAQNTATTPTSTTPPPLSPGTTSTSFPTLPLSDFSQSQPQHPHHLQYNPHHHHSSHSSPSTPTSFSFQTQLPSPTHPHTPYTNASSSPLSSPTTTALPLFDFTIARTPPILQAPMRFKRFSSTPNFASLVNNNPPSTSSVSPDSHFSLPTSASNTPPLSHQIPSCFSSFLNSSYSTSDFHAELQKENQEMCSLLAAVTQPELPSSQFVSTANRIGIPSVSKFSKRATKKKFGNSVKDKVNGKLGFALEDLLKEAKVLTECGQTYIDQSSLILQEEKPKLLMTDGFGSYWDQPDSLALSPGMDQKVEDGGQLNMMPEDFIKVLNDLPSSTQPELYSDRADISNGQSSVITDDNIGFEMQMASLFPPADHGRTLGSCSWDNLPGIC